MSEEFVMSKEHEAERAALIKRYGQTVFDQAVELSGLRLCLRGLSYDEMTPKEREQLYRQASLHLAGLLEMVMSGPHAAKVTECAGALDSTVDQWIGDEAAMKKGL